MALIECKGCGKQISDQAKVCPNCGEILIPDPVHKTILCEECGCEIPADAATCPNCGHPMTSTSNNISKAETSATNHGKSKKIIAGVVIASLLIAIVIAAQSASKAAEAKRISEEYASNLSACIATMYTGALEAEQAGGLIHDVWYNTIFEKYDDETDKYTTRSGAGWSFNDDFNDSLSALFNDVAFQTKIDRIELNQSLVASFMKELKNPPEEYKDAYDAVKSLYEAYCDITECAVDPSGNLSSYTAKFNSADSDFVKYYKVVSLYE